MPRTKPERMVQQLAADAMLHADEGGSPPPRRTMRRIVKLKIEVGNQEICGKHG
jgi:hypothetical protein